MIENTDKKSLSEMEANVASDSKRMPSISKGIKYVIGAMLPICILVTMLSLSCVGSDGELFMADGIKPGKRKAVLILPNGNKIELSTKDTLVPSGIPDVMIKIDSCGMRYVNLDDLKLEEQNQAKDVSQLLK